MLNSEFFQNTKDVLAKIKEWPIESEKITLIVIYLEELNGLLEKLAELFNSYNNLATSLAKNFESVSNQLKTLDNRIDALEKLQISQSDLIFQNSDHCNLLKNYIDKKIESIELKISNF